MLLKYNIFNRYLLLSFFFKNINFNYYVLSFMKKSYNLFKQKKKVTEYFFEFGLIYLGKLNFDNTFFEYNKNLWLQKFNLNSTD